MKELQEELTTYLEKAYKLTQMSLKYVQEEEFDKLTQTLDNRERALNIIESLSEKLSLYGKNKDTPLSLIDFNQQVHLIIQKINNMDDIITSCLEHEKNKTQFEIAKTFKNKENFKGYNLNKLK